MNITKLPNNSYFQVNTKFYLAIIFLLCVVPGVFLPSERCFDFPVRIFSNKSGQCPDVGQT